MYGTLIVLGHFVAIVWHLLILARLHFELTTGRVVLFTSLVNVVSFTALILLWTRFRKLAGRLLFVFLGVGLAIGGYVHFLSAGPDNVFGCQQKDRDCRFRLARYCSSSWKHQVFSWALDLYAGVTPLKAGFWGSLSFLIVPK